MMPLEDILAGISLKDIIYFAVGVTGVISIIVEKSKLLPFNPWSSLFKWMGNIMTKDISDKLDSLEQTTIANKNAITDLEKKVEDKFEEQQKEDDEKEAKRLRSNIINFVDSCRNGDAHTQTHYEDVMRAYDDYKALCKKRDIQNHFIDSDYKYIEEFYHEKLRTNDFSLRR